eukprot:Gregarina_sp_Poly_1__2255@NODE_15_length_23029_cov_81_474305_g13_i0_p21_GENE_NODE_15_length_23029_cov_81_474305_g13_i0NODE_15_length_23029_cov_81_474305_g13_i0_p21_ORF_typecomplete_len115_score20_37AAA_27/PF13514_6/0_27_NODE_15_length_23029_cov_81_474305_g13_i02124321587
MEKWAKFLGELNNEADKRKVAVFSKDSTSTAESVEQVHSQKKSRRDDLFGRAQHSLLSKASGKTKPLRIRKNLKFESKLLKPTKAQQEVERALKAKKVKRKAVRRDVSCDDKTP